MSHKLHFTAAVAMNVICKVVVTVDSGQLVRPAGLNDCQPLAARCGPYLSIVRCCIATNTRPLWVRDTYYSRKKFQQMENLEPSVTEQRSRLGKACNCLSRIIAHQMDCGRGDGKVFSQIRHGGGTVILDG